jgi:hypothetical protein
MANEKLPKAILISGFTDEEIRELLRCYRENKKLPRTIFATVTETALEWKVKDWLKELEEEDRYFKKQLKNKGREK